MNPSYSSVVHQTFSTRPSRRPTVRARPFESPGRPASANGSQVLRRSGAYDALPRPPALPSFGEQERAFERAFERALGPEEQTAAAREVAALTRGIAELPERLQQVLALYYQHDCTLREVAAVLGVTESRVSQLHAEAMKLLRAEPRGAAAGPEPHDARRDGEAQAALTGRGRTVSTAGGAPLKVSRREPLPAAWKAEPA